MKNTISPRVVCCFYSFSFYSNFYSHSLYFCSRFALSLFLFSCGCLRLPFVDPGRIRSIAATADLPSIIVIMGPSSSLFCLSAQAENVRVMGRRFGAGASLSCPCLSAIPSLLPGSRIKKETRWDWIDRYIDVDRYREKRGKIKGNTERRYKNACSLVGGWVGERPKYLCVVCVCAPSYLL